MGQTVNEYLDAYHAAIAHQAEHSGLVRSWMEPDEVCPRCPLSRAADYRPHGIKRRYAWAIPNDAALDALAAQSPRGIVEIGAGGGYWARLLRARGVDVAAYDPDPIGLNGWHDGHRWSEVLPGDHTAVTAHPDRTLLLVWPSYGGAWTDAVLDLYAGPTVAYVGEGPGGCTGTNRMHALLGMGTDCWHDVDTEPCGCVDTQARFALTRDVTIPRWAGIHDRLTLHRRLAG